MDVTPSWSAVSQKIVGLWPRFDPTEQERSLIASRLSKLNMRWLETAVEEYRCASESTVFRIAELLDHYKRIANAGEAKLVGASTSVQAQAERERIRYEKDVLEARAWLEQRSRGEIADAIAVLRKTGWIGNGTIPGRIADWRPNTALMVRARIELDEQRSSR